MTGSMRFLKSLSFAWKTLFVISGLWLGLVTIRQAPRLSVGLGNASAFLLIAIGLSAWDPFELWLEMRSTKKEAERLQWIADMQRNAGTPTPPLFRFNLIKLLRWLAMNWTWTVLFVGLGGCVRAGFVSNGPLELFKVVGFTAALAVVAAGIQELPKGAANILEIRLREEIGAAKNPEGRAMAQASMILGSALLMVVAWWTWHVYGK
jgi:hypothetical protein